MTYMRVCVLNVTHIVVGKFAEVVGDVLGRHNNIKQKNRRNSYVKGGGKDEKS